MIMMVALELWHYVELQGGDLIASAGFSREKMRLLKKYDGNQGTHNWRYCFGNLISVE